MDAPSLPNDIPALHALVQQYLATLSAQQREIEQLKHYVALLLRARYGPRSEKVDPNQLALFDVQSAENADDGVTPQALPDDTSLDVVVREHCRRGGGRTALPEDLPREPVEHDLAEHEKPCPECGRVRERIGVETSE